MVGLIDLGPDDVAGQQIGCALDSPEAPVDGFGNHPRGRRLGQAGNAFDEQVPAGQQRDQHRLAEMVLADHPGRRTPRSPRRQCAEPRRRRAWSARNRGAVVGPSPVIWTPGPVRTRLPRPADVMLGARRGHQNQRPSSTAMGGTTKVRTSRVSMSSPMPIVDPTWAIVTTLAPSIANMVSPNTIPAMVTTLPVPAKVRMVAVRTPPGTRRVTASPAAGCSPRRRRPGR